MDSTHVAQVFLGIMIVLITLVFLSKPFWAYDHYDTVRVLEASGYTNIKTNGYAWFKCSKGDFWQTAFEADAPNKTRVTGAVCSGLVLKGNTVRLD